MARSDEARSLGYRCIWFTNHATSGWKPGVLFAGALRCERLPARNRAIAFQGGDRLIMETTNDPISAESCVVRSTDSRKGRTRSIAPGTTAARHLHYGRIILDARDEPVSFSTGEHETSLICLKGNATVSVKGDTFELGLYDSLYIPRDSEAEVAPRSEGCDLAEISSPVANRYPLQLVRFADVQRDSTLHFKAGGATAEREVNILIGKNVEAGRLLAGVTFSKPGNWTSWPPHEHAAMLEEAYLYIDMPAPSFGLQLVYTDAKEPEIARNPAIIKAHCPKRAFLINRNISLGRTCRRPIVFRSRAAGGRGRLQ